MQSSSGGDEEYDSRADTISSFLNPPPPHQPPQQQLHHHHNHHHASMFDPLSNYFDTSSRSSNPNSLLNLDMVWPKTLRSEPDLGGAFMAASSSSSSCTQQLFTNQAVLPPSRANTFSPLHNLPHHHHQTESVSNLNIDKTNPIMATTNNTNTGGGGGNNSLVRNPKKRSRASRRAPTTVLTTDTSNFRAMVQEFTGIPAPPFTSSPFPRTRLDLFGTSTSSLRSSSSHLDPSPPYLLRPFAQKFHTLPPFVSPPGSSTPSTSSSSPSMIDAIAAASTSTNLTSATPSNNNNNHNNTSINYQNLLNMNNSTMQNPILNLQSLLQPQNKFSLSNSTILANKPQGSPSSLDNMNHHHPSNEESHLKIGVLEELGLSGHGHLNTNLNSGGLQNIVSSTPTFENDQAAAAGTANESDHQGLLRSPFSGGGNNYNNNSQQRVSNGKVNTFSASSSDFLREKVQENVGTTTRTEGMVESWICSSD
ncbi:hypothetical protein Pint_26621 [Pistacia integerrima]|uniref:Uncharacterized protein n=1 Tax=Pistacia integerrima TaxID=434235 RepID=A0ACC0YTA0_9ROSI|nr:hypothetical protein Pint_26621 [Pistacia integerrima]